MNICSGKFFSSDCEDIKNLFSKYSVDIYLFYYSFLMANTIQITVYKYAIEKALRTVTYLDNYKTEAKTKIVQRTR
jgi:hypothetical protein